MAHGEETVMARRAHGGGREARRVWALGEGSRALGDFGERDDVQALNIGA
jgi:hypothetical protein